MGISLELKTTPDISLEADCVNPSVTDLEPDAISRLKLWQGRVQVELGEFFSVSEIKTERQDELHVTGDLSRVKYLGKGTSSGKMTIWGSCGMHTCEGMKGGEVEIYGDAANWCFCAMQGGQAKIHGSAGAFLAAAFPGDARGMKGGVIWVRGDVGARAVERMRRGLLVVGGTIGELAAAEMIAGTVVSLGRLSERAGASMKRGAILAMGSCDALLTGFEWSCTYNPTFVGMLGRELYKNGLIDDPSPFTNAERGFSRWCGDMVSMGKGEILIREK
ncbi:MAG: formylmethanofuran dehydrogenase subunit C [Synergistaceae bacterium]|jgi:formylmethanofuran dehydrogenase subunit C|nr:formylmethanofuran dehydrogenase subunit C [Synergistaceae bacterium]